ncbi:hypothetical protein Pfo_008952, partial [Paulownia fortunei]
MLIGDQVAWHLAALSQFSGDLFTVLRVSKSVIIIGIRAWFLAVTIIGCAWWDNCSWKLSLDLLVNRLWLAVMAIGNLDFIHPRTSELMWDLMGNF